MLLAVALVAIAGVVTLSGCGSSGAGRQPTASAAAQPPVTTYAGSSVGASIAIEPSKGTASDISAAEKAELARVRIVRVTIGADGQYIGVQFTAPPKLVKRWRAGMLGVIDERTKRVYDQIPVVPVLGALFGRPASEGQIGYVMLANVPRLQPGAVVTVVLGAFRQKHVQIR
jgi:hypothetical protein